MDLFFCSKLIFGKRAINYLKNIKGKKCFLITDEILKELGLLKVLTDKLKSYNKDFQIFTEVKPNPHEEDILIAKKLCVDYNPDIIIGLGGGSAIDTAKAVWAMYEVPELKLDDIEPNNEEMEIIGEKAKLIAIPTTSGTGADTTYAIVISRKVGGIWKKLDLMNSNLLPTYTIVDPLFPKQMPRNLTIDTGFDALSHALESLVSYKNNKYSEAMSIQAMELIFEYLPVVTNDLNNIEARDFLHQAATMAGFAENNSPANLGHSMGYGLGDVFNNLSHGKTVGILLPYILEFLINNPRKRDKTMDLLSKVSQKLGWCKWENTNIKENAFFLVRKLRDLQKNVNFPNNLNEIISEKDFKDNLDTMVNLTMEYPGRVLSPRKAKADDIRKIYQYAFRGKSIDF